MIDALRLAVPFEEFDYQTLLHSLQNYARPRDRITRLLAAGAIVRVKKGLYVFGAAYRRGPCSLELLANLISGPSYVSYEYALARYGLIPEHVAVMTSATLGPARTFATPLGRFTYRPVPARVFPVGVTRDNTGAGRAFLIATREKALCDTLVAARGVTARTRGALQHTLADDLRIDTEQLASFDTSVISHLADLWRSRRLALLAEVIARA